VQPLAVVRIGSVIVDYFSAIMTLIGIIVIFTALICAAIWTVVKVRRRLRSNTEKLSADVYVSFKTLRQKLLEQIEYLDGKPGLTRDEQRVHDKLKEALDDSENTIGREIKNIQKDLK